MHLVHKYNELLDNMALKCPFVDLNIYIYNRAFKCPFVAIANVRLRSIWGYNIENARDWRIYNKGRFKAIAKTNNIQQTPIRMHIEHT